MSNGIEKTSFDRLSELFTEVMQLVHDGKRDPDIFATSLQEMLWRAPGTGQYTEEYNHDPVHVKLRPGWTISYSAPGTIHLSDPRGNSIRAWNQDGMPGDDKIYVAIENTNGFYALAQLIAETHGLAISAQGEGLGTTATGTIYRFVEKNI